MAEYDARAQLAELEAVVSALAHASRRQILLILQFRGGQMSAGDIAKRFHHAWPTISRHLRLLEEAGLVVHEQRGRTRTYRLVTSKLDVVREWLRWFEPAQASSSEASRAMARAKRKRR